MVKKKARWQPQELVALTMLTDSFTGIFAWSTCIPARVRARSISVESGQEHVLWPLLLRWSQLSCRRESDFGAVTQDAASELDGKPASCSWVCLRFGGSVSTGVKKQTGEYYPITAPNLTPCWRYFVTYLDYIHSWCYSQVGELLFCDFHMTITNNSSIIFESIHLDKYKLYCLR